jgi:DNA polymerase
MSPGRSVHASSAESFLPDDRALPALRAAAPGCRGCDLYQRASQVVFGDGPATARMVLIGEQPGDVEDRQGRPFVGPAGGVLRRALDSAGIDVAEVYLTNAVKHFRWKSTGNSPRRLHATPTRTEVIACRPWLLAELDAVDPDVVVALGATAAKSLLGPAFTLSKHRGTSLDWPPELATGRGRLFATIHPSAVLRAGDARDQELAGLIEDLRTARGAA